MSASCKPLALVLALGVAACASGSPQTDAAPSPTPAQPTAQPRQPAAQPNAQPAQQPAAPAAAGGPFFTAAQADAGRDTFRSVCTECHYSSEFSDQQFKFKWSRRNADSLYDFIFTQMPESAPGSLSPTEAISLVSYILRLNGFEAGPTALAPDPAVLSTISLRSIRN